MNKYIVAPEGCKWSETEATTAEMAYRGICSWYNSNTRIAIINPVTGHTAIYTRQLDTSGNLVKICRE